MGPYFESERAVNMGVACHIYAASEDGPRGWGEKDEEFISSADIDRAVQRIRPSQSRVSGAGAQTGCLISILKVSSIISIINF